MKRGVIEELSTIFSRATRSSSIEGKKKASERYYLIFVPMRFEDILPALADGRGDIGAANFTVTDERAEIVDFAAPYLPDVDEIVVTHGGGPAIDAIDDLSGRSLYVLAGSSYVEHLEALNERFVSEGKAPLEIVEAEPDLDHADILELINSGVVDLTVVDAHIAKVWTSVFPKLVLKSDIVVSGGGNIAWAVRKNIPDFMASVNSYVKKVKKGTMEGNIAFKNYYKSRRWVRNPLDPDELTKLDKVVKYMKRYGERYTWDWIAVAAQAYQESGLDQRKVSPAGAVGIMQVLPSTAAQKPISIKNIESVEANIHAGVKYLNFVRKRYFSDPEIAPEDRDRFLLGCLQCRSGKNSGIAQEGGKTWIRSQQMVQQRGTHGVRIHRPGDGRLRGQRQQILYCLQVRAGAPRAPTESAPSAIRAGRAFQTGRGLTGMEAELRAARKLIDLGA